ncbi:Thiol-disulfide isomerase or thioredoxin [Mucilaginibacter pineti]|uniref:Thiol-disulfide isomerase or thioredoxin n=1 Tax=Mucilaginibacter pineti TaxID=1391627 RepID=A0A1G7P2G2_9SPHI|nr:TlpA disulfide reductase family protein [Mucilaginibacter pineti]SDF80485.1 Thiol-disulfide isomerase or thioredoxin [Mucilaginibacter pineti]
MKKIILNIVLAVLCLNFAAHAQDKTPNIAALKIGDKVPDITISNILNYKDVSGKPTASAKISDFKGKLLILDFWATWCSPCIAMIPKMDSLQKEFAGKVQFLPVSYQSEKDIKSFLARRQKKVSEPSVLPEVVNDFSLKSLFPHNTLPHYVWIDASGKVAGITGYETVNKANIVKILSDNQPEMPEKSDFKIPYNRDEALFVGNNGGSGKNIIYHSMLTGYANGISPGTYTPLPDSNKNQRIRVINGEILSLFQLAYRDLGRFNRNRIEVKSKDSLILSYHFKEPELEWFKKHSYCYDLLLPPGMTVNKYNYFRDDLQRIFPGYEVKIEQQVRHYLALQRTSDINKLRSLNGPQIWKQDQYGLTMHYQNWKMFYWTLDDYFFQKSPLPIIDETGLKGAIDIELNADMSNINSLNNALKNYDLKIVEKLGSIAIMVISDRPDTH